MLIREFQQPWITVRNLDECLEGLREGSGVLKIDQVAVRTQRSLLSRTVPLFCPSRTSVISFEPSSKQELPRRAVAKWKMNGCDGVLHLKRGIKWSRFYDQYVNIDWLPFSITKSGIVLSPSGITVVMPMRMPRDISIAQQAAEFTQLQREAYEIRFINPRRPPELHANVRYHYIDLSPVEEDDHAEIIPS